MSEQAGGEAPAPALVCVASHKEAEAVLRGLGAPASVAHAPDWTLLRGPGASERLDVIITGVGKANAAGAAMRAIEPLRHRLVLCVGIGGLLPGFDAALGTRVLATSCVFGDEGAQTPESFVDVGALGFPPAPGVRGVAMPTDRRFFRALRGLADAEGGVATVSTCSGTDALAHEMARRTGAMVEAMEGAAVALVAHRLGVPFGELRVLSNTTGDRARQRWDMGAALGALERVAAGLSELVSPGGRRPSPG